MSEVIEIGDIGRVEYAFKFPRASANGQPGELKVTLDVVQVSDEINELWWRYAGADSKIPQDKLGEHREATNQHVRDSLNKASGGVAQDLVARLSSAQLAALLANVSKQVKALKPFFSDDSGGAESPAASSDVTYSP